MSCLPTFQTDRLVLRPFVESDAGDVQRLAGDRLVAATTLTIPHPYEDGMAEAWIATHEPSWELGQGLVLAITLRGTGEVIGAIGLIVEPNVRSAELGFWVGVPFWGRGYCTEAARAMIDHGFSGLELQRIHARHLTRNPASGRVLEKSGMTADRVVDRAVCKWGELLDLRFLSITREQWEQGRRDRPQRVDCG